MTHEPPLSVLFLCTGNSARSIMAEAIANQHCGDRLVACSAGTAPGGSPHVLALETLKTHGHSVKGLCSKHVDVFADRSFDLIITLCESVKEACPVPAGGQHSGHWGFPDPPASTDPAHAFHAVYGGIGQVLRIFLAAPGSLDDRIACAAEVADRFAAATLPNAPPYQ